MESMSVPPDMVRRTVDIHEALKAWLRATYPHENPLVVLAACSYEIARIVTVVGPDLSSSARERLLQDVIEVMRAQIMTGMTE